MSKLAFLFLTKGNHNCEIAWNYFFKEIDSNLYNIYCHPKKIPTQSFLKDNLIANITQTNWGDISLIKATLLLLVDALSDPNNGYFILVSDSCIPVVNFSDLYNSLFSDNKSYIYWSHKANRYERYLKLSNHLRQKISFNHFYSQHQWMILNRKHSIIATKINLLHDFRTVHACDEHYFVTLFHLTGLLDREFNNKKTTYCDWSNKKAMHPRLFKHIDEILLDKAHNQGTFFIRKVDRECKLCQYLQFILQLKDKESN